ncbi:hypothetical protein PJP05_28800, partial [Mycobacterium kansasii]
MADMQDVFYPRVIKEMVGPSTLLAHFQVQPLLKDEIATTQQQDPETMEWIKEVHKGRLPGFSVYDEILRYGSRLCVPKGGD